MHPKQAAILAADVVSYGRHMSEDEERTLAGLDRLFALFSRKVAAHEGRVFGRAADSIMAVFESPVEAVRGAAELQRTLVAERPATSLGPLQLRLAVNLGDVVEEEADVYGDGVSTAARLPALASPDGVVVSRATYEHVRGRTGLRFVDLGSHRLHDLAKPVRAYAARLSGGGLWPDGWLRLRRHHAVAATLVAILVAVGATQLNRIHDVIDIGELRRLPPQAPAGPSLAVIPFLSLSSGQDHAYLANGFTEDLIADLAKIHALSIVAYNSVDGYRDREDAAGAAARDLKVRYVLLGSLRRLNDKLRVSATLVDTATGGHLWAERFDANYAKIFDLQHRIVANIAGALALRVTSAERSRIDERDTRSVAAYDAYRRGWAHSLRKTPDGLTAALGLFRQAVAIDPDYSRAYAAIGLVYWNSWIWGWEASVGETWATAPVRAKEFAQRALRRPTATAYQLASQIDLYARRYEEARRFGELAVELDGSDPSSHIALAEAYVYTGEPALALAPLEMAMRLDPLFPAYTEFVLGLATLGLDRLDAAAKLFERALERNPDDFAPAAPLAAIRLRQGRRQAAEEAFAIYRKGWPEANVEEFKIYWPYTERSDQERILGPLRALGLPETLS
jgi:TolB-like protein/class 3 adenylate cyclase